MVAGGLDKHAQFYEASTGRELFYVTHESRINDVAFSPDGTKLITAAGDGRYRGVPGPDNSVRVWQIAP